MSEIINIKVSIGKKTEMIRWVSHEIKRALSEVVPPFNSNRDIVRLEKYRRDPDRIRLTYEILRDARPSKIEEKRSPYREKGIVMKVGMNT